MDGDIENFDWTTVLYLLLKSVFDMSFTHEI